MRALAMYVGVGIPILLAFNFHYLEEEWKLFLYMILFCNFCLAFFAILRTAGRKTAITPHPSRVPLLSLLLLGVLSLTTILHEANQSNQGSLQLKTWLGALIWILPAPALPALAKNGDDLRLVFKWIDIGLGIVSGSVILSAVLASLGMEFGEVLIFRESSSRTFGPLGDQVGFISALGVLLALARGSIPLILFHTVAISLTGTRGAMLVVASGAMVHIVMIGLSRRRDRGKLILYAVLGLCAVGVVLYTGVGETLVSRVTNRDVLDATMFTRFTSMEIGVDIFRENPWVGVGYAGFNQEAAVRGAHLYFRQFSEGYISNATNQFIEIAVSGGTIGLIIYISFLIASVRALYRVCNAHDRILGKYFKGALLWFSGMFIGNQAAIWLQINSLAAILFLIFPFLAVRFIKLHGSASHSIFAVPDYSLSTESTAFQASAPQ